MKDYWIWCGSVIKEDGKYHMFASRWSKKVDFDPYWLTNSEIVRAESDTPEGPYTFKEVVLKPRGMECWDGMMTHNPAIRKIDDHYVLYYTGTTYEGGMPDENNKINNESPLKIQAHKGERIGMAYSKSIYGPWIRMDSPIIDVVPDTWEKYLVSNPAPFVGADGRIYVMYKGVTQLETHSMGIVVADDFRGPYRAGCQTNHMIPLMDVKMPVYGMKMVNIMRWRWIIIESILIRKYCIYLRRI